METIEIAIPRSASYRATEMVSDLRNAIETLFFPMRVVGYWDVPSGDHLCPQAQRGNRCPHALPPHDPQREDYLATVERDLDGVLEVVYSHARVRLYLT
ncbi:MAG: hypothetical protein V3V35_03435 [Dehalococcoidia bacterium]